MKQREDEIEKKKITCSKRRTFFFTFKTSFYSL